MSFLITSVWSKHPLLSLHVQFYNFPIDHNALLQIKHTYLYIMFWIEQTFTDRHTAISWEPALIEKALGMATKVQGLIVSWWEMIVRWLVKTRVGQWWKALIGSSYIHQVILSKDGFAGLLDGRWGGCRGYIKYCFIVGFIVPYNITKACLQIFHFIIFRSLHFTIMGLKEFKHDLIL